MNIKFFTPLIILGCFFSISNAQTTIAIQDFEAAPAAPTMAFTNVGGSLAAGAGTAPNTNMFLGARSYQVSNTTGTVTFSTINTTAFSSVFLRLRLASFSIVSSTNGADAADNVSVEISTDGGTTWSNEYQINGNSNARWDFSATGTASSSYDGNNIPFVSTASPGTQVNGISTITINNLPSITTLRVRITMLNNASNEVWALDNVELLGTPAIVCPHTLVGFVPNNGPVGTEVTLSGTGFTGSTAVDFNNLSIAQPLLQPFQMAQVPEISTSQNLPVSLQVRVPLR